MGLARAHAIALVGVQGHPVEIEADIENGMVALLLVGLPDTALREARDRIRSAIVNSGETWPTRRITVGLSPASLPKRGSGFDLGIAVAILAASGTLPAAGLDDFVLMGELGLDGRIRPVPGVLPAAAAAADGHRREAAARRLLLGCKDGAVVGFCLASSHQEGQEIADGGFRAGGFGQRQVRLDLVAVAAPALLLDDIPGCGQVRDDRVGAALGDAQPGRDLAQPHAGVTCDAEQDPGVVGEKVPAFHAQKLITRFQKHIARF